MQTVSIRYSGEVSDINLNYLTSVIVRSLLAPVLREGINLVNAMHVANSAESGFKRPGYRRRKILQTSSSSKLKTDVRIAPGFRNRVHR